MLPQGDCSKVAKEELLAYSMECQWELAFHVRVDTSQAGRLADQRMIP